MNNLESIKQKNSKVKNAIFIGALSAISYLACYFCRKILSVVSPEIIKSTDITVEFANAVAQIGWGNLILVWAMLMFVGVVIAIPKNKFVLSINKKSRGFD